MIYPAISNLISMFSPKLGNVAEYALTRYGGKLQSEDPYAVSV